MKATRKTVADAIECLLTCADRRLLTWEVTSRYEVADLAGAAFTFIYEEHAADAVDWASCHLYGAAASLLHEGWLPEGWTR